MKLASFFHRLVESNWITLSIALVTFAMFNISLVVINSNRLHTILAFYPGYSNPNGYFYLFDRLTRFKQKVNDTSLKIVIVGGSTTKEAIWNEADLAYQISELSGNNISVVDLTSAAQNPAVSWALLEQTACQGAHIAIIGLNIGRLRRVPRSNSVETFGYKSEFVDGYMANKHGGSRPSNHAFFNDAYPFVIASYNNIAGALFKNGLRAERKKKARRTGRHVYINRELPSNEQWEARQETVDSTHLDNFENRLRDGMFFYEEMIHYVRRCKAYPVILDSPLHPVLRDANSTRKYGAAYKQYRAYLKQVLTKLNVSSVYPNDVISYQPDDFHDFGHLRTERAMKATTTHIAQQIAAIIQTLK